MKITDLNKEYSRAENQIYYIDNEWFFYSLVMHRKEILGDIDSYFMNANLYCFKDTKSHSTVKYFGKSRFFDFLKNRVLRFEERIHNYCRVVEHHAIPVVIILDLESLLEVCPFLKQYTGGQGQFKNVLEEADSAFVDETIAKNIERYKRIKEKILQLETKF